MFTRPTDLTDDEVGAALVRGWELDVRSVEHAPLGFGSHHWSVTTADDRRWFATADDLRRRRVGSHEPRTAPFDRLRAALMTARALREHGLAWVVAPCPAAGGEVVVALGGAYALSLYPWVEGRTFGWGPYEDPADRSAVLGRLVELHTTTGCRDVAAVDDLGGALVAGLRGLLEDPGPPWHGGPFSREAWHLVVDRAGVLAALLDRYAGLLGDADPSRFVVTHGEPHRGNIVVTDTGVALVDWDTCLLAPPERDVWLVTGEQPGLLADYERRTGRRLDARVLEAYRLRWDLADVASSAAELRGPHGDDDDTRTSWAALRGVLTSASGSP